MAADTFLHTVDKRATPAIWRESVEKVEFEKETKKTLSEQTVEELIAERYKELIEMSNVNRSHFEIAVGSERYQQIMSYASMGTEEFKQKRRKTWTHVDMMTYGARMLILLLKCFKNRRKYVAEFDYVSNPAIKEPPKRAMKNRSMMRSLTCQAQFRSEEDIQKISYYLQPLSDLTVLFPKDMQKELCRRVTYTNFDHGRIICSQVNMIKNIELSEGKVVSKSIGWLTKHNHLDVGDVEQCRPSEYQLVSVGSTQVLYLDTDWFQVLRKFNERVPRLFLSNLPLFKEYPLEHLLDQAGAVESIFFEPNKTVCKNLKSTEYFYICKSGTCAIVRRQQTIDVKKSNELVSIPTAHTADSLASRRIFLHAYETIDPKLQAASNLNYLDVKRPSMADYRTSPKKVDKWALLDRYACDRNKVVTKKSFLKIGVFRRGNIAGLHEQNMTSKEGVTNLSLISDGAEIVKVHKKRFLLLAVPRTLAEVQVLFATYRLEGEVKEEVAEREKWTHYRKNYVSSLMSERQRERVMLQPRGNPNLIH
ncbi:uncharacterized protein LOC142337129 isoform X2 [Convolutriloba macropyga]|uniref:uncharacterized protein LOC142337129 isoform X2 n=1 Tax=Convolutriloba macropyga TaxID=536237 RepID=UPI003F52665F